MTVMKQQSSKAGSFTFYGVQYSRFGSRLAAEVRLEAYGEDLGQQGWRSLDEQVEIIGLVQESPQGKLLDVACGSGGPSIAIAAATGCRLTGVDIEEAAIEHARALAAAAHLPLGATFVVADCSEQLPFDREEFDVVSCIDAIIHLASRREVFADWFRLLRPGGRLILTDACVLTGIVSKEELDIRASQGKFHIVPAAFNELMLERAGFELRLCRDTTEAVSNLALRLYHARESRRCAMLEEEGVGWFENRQAFLKTTAELAVTGRLSRFLYVAEKPIHT
ncbi:Demethylrebeccamycin-D-glucose O-methyltransferase [Ensifer adhaerens]|uniref:class I SAM-dependent methyltransferase n=1 Tax=Ensifer adhaerens TaxID=106592 RepID=UPI001569D3FD|nr:class I SAM-dependent methyltransferase [Ensifer adhaerens]NRP21664.1 Demethylrebeccamycin-D-glucose O-methyltransferase [Ensifer adhaerens]